VRIIDLSATAPITSFQSVGARSRLLVDGQGEAHVHCVHFEAGGSIGEHPAGFAQLFIVIAGAGWAAGADGCRVEIGQGQGVLFERGERHSKGSDHGMTALMVQVTDLQLLV
jgi:quercetin dioxygenase-like cupin family protein